MSAMKIIHTSDWHLGARLHEEDRADEQRAFLEWLLELMAEERPDALVVAGDVFDVKAPSPAAQRLYYGFLAKAVKSGTCGKVVVVAGNHDSAGLLAAPARLLGELDIAVVARAQDGEAVAEEVVEVKDADGVVGLVVAAVPFMYEAELVNFGAERVPPDAPREVRIAAGWRSHYADVITAARAKAQDVPLVVTGHCTAANAEFSDADSERCRRIGGIDVCDVTPLAEADYVALGHLHRPQPVKGHETKMFYSGAPLRMSFDEADGAKCVNVVTFPAAGKSPEVRLVKVPQTVPIFTVDGRPDEVRARLAELAADRERLRYVRLRLRDFEGSARSIWEELRLIVNGTRTHVLEENDMRPVDAALVGLGAFMGRRIQEVSPRDMAERKLRTSCAHYSDGQMADFMALFDETMRNMDGGAS
jgi:exonuclease SbcD